MTQEKKRLKHRINLREVSSPLEEWVLVGQSSSNLSGSVVWSENDPPQCDFCGGCLEALFKESLWLLPDAVPVRINDVKGILH